MRTFFFALLALCICSSFTLKSKLLKAELGDYIVTEQDKIASVLLVRSLTSSKLVLEEISAPMSAIKTPPSWAKWVQERAPGHTSWTLYEIDLKTNQLSSCYSVSQKIWIKIEESELFFPKLLALPLQPVEHDKRKRIGPAPQADEEDHRALWIPAVVSEGKKVEKPVCEVFQARWPEDNSLLSLCAIELYFTPALSFPYWIELSNGHYTLKIRTIDSGKGLVSPFNHVTVTAQQREMDNGRGLMDENGQQRKMD
jgi:hypothetical protein